MYVSALPNLWACPSSQAPTEHPYAPQSDAADAGSAAHDALAEVVDGREPDIPAIAQRYQVPEKDVDILAAVGRRAWDEIKADFPTAYAEHRLSSKTYDLRGRADVFGMDGAGGLSVVDWKTNRARTKVRPQLEGYALCAAEQYGLDPGGRVRVYTVWLRLGIIDCATMRNPDIGHFIAQLDRKRGDIGRAYAPGDACTYCRRQLECQARRLYIKDAVTALVDQDTPGVPVAADLALLYHRAKALRGALGRYDAALKAALQDGPLPDGRDGTLQLETQTREDIDPQAAWPVLTDLGYTESDLAACMAVKAGACMDVVRGRAPRGQKGAAEAALKKSLREAGAVSVRTFESIKLTKGNQQ